MYINLQLDIRPTVADDAAEVCDYGGNNSMLMPGVFCGTTKNVQPNGEFILENYYAINHLVEYSCCDWPYPDVTYYVLLRRRPMFYVFNLILPCVLINSIGKEWSV